MSEGWTERIEAAYAAFNRGDLPGALALFSPDVVAVDHDRTLDDASYRGHEGFLRLAMTVNEGFVDVAYEPERIEEVGDRVLVELRRRGRGAASGIEVEERQYHVLDVDGEHVVRFASYIDRDQARAAAGLPADG